MDGMNAGSAEIRQKRSVAKVFLTDDHILYREGLRRLIDDWDGFEVIGEAGNGIEAVEFVRSHRDIDLVLLDVCMPEMDGVEAVRRIHLLRPELPVVMLTVSVGDDDIFGALENGAVGYVLKDTTARQLRNRLREVLDGKGTLSAEVASTVIQRISESPDSLRVHDAEHGAYAKALANLTTADREILRLVRDGASNEEIAATVYMSVPSVKKRLSKYLRIFDAENRVQLAVLVSKLGDAI